MFFTQVVSSEPLEWSLDGEPKAEPSKRFRHASVLLCCTASLYCVYCPCGLCCSWMESPSLSPPNRFRHCVFSTAFLYCLHCRCVLSDCTALCCTSMPRMYSFSSYCLLVQFPQNQNQNKHMSKQKCLRRFSLLHRAVRVHLPDDRMLVAGHSDSMSEVSS